MEGDGWRKLAQGGFAVKPPASCESAAAMCASPRSKMCSDSLTSTAKSGLSIYYRSTLSFGFVALWL